MMIWSENDQEKLSTNQNQGINFNLDPSSKSPKKKSGFWRKLLNGFLILIALAFICVMGTIMFWPILQFPSIAPGADVGSFAYIGKYIGDYLHEFGRLPHLIPYWYNNWEVLHTSPHLISLVMGFLSYFWRDMESLSRVFQLCLAMFVAFSMFWLLKKMKYSTFNALFGAILMGLGQSVIVDLAYVGGNFARILALSFLPLSFYFLHNVLENKGNRWANIGLLAMMLALGILSHALVGLSTILMLSFYAAIRLMIDRKLRTASGIFYVSIAIFLAMLLSFFYIAPFLTEKVGWTDLPESVFWGTSILGWGYFQSRYGFILILLLPLFVFFKKPKTSIDWSLLVTAAFAYLFSLGSFTPVYKIFSFLNIYPFLGSFFFAFSLAYLAATSIDFAKATRFIYKFLLVIVFIGVVAYQGWAGYVQSVSTRDFQTDNYKLPQTEKILAEIKNTNNAGRMMPMKYPFPDYLLWWSSIYHIPMVEGWYYSTTNQGKHIALMYDAINYNYPDYVVRRLAQMNTRFFLANSYFYSGNSENYLQFLPLLEKAGFGHSAEAKGVGEEVGYHLYYQDQASSYFNPVKESTLVIGRDGGVTATVTPGSIQAGSQYLDDYDQEVLSHFSSLVLSGFSYHNKEKAEGLAREYVKNGGRVIIDMNRMNSSLLEESPNFLGVTGVQQIAKSKIGVEIENEALSDLIPKAFEIPSELDPDDIAINRKPDRLPLKEFRYMEYLNLDYGLAKRAEETDDLTHMIGYKLVEGRKVWFVGPNIFYHAFLNHSQKELKLIDSIISGEDKSQPENNGQISAKMASYSDVITPYLYDKTCGDNEAQITDEVNELEYKKISYKSSEKFPMLAAYSYSPHWKAYLDGNEIKIYSIEDLTFMSLPAGEHSLEMKYENIPVHTYSKIISEVTLLIIVALIIIKRKKKRRNA